MFAQDLSSIFSAGGALAQSFSAYQARAGQLALAQAIQETLEQEDVLVAEAGTGTGKTWAYLVPALLSGRKVLISTGTRALQDQLFHRDIPRVRQALALSARVALLKGRSNYVCHYHLERLQGDDRGLESRAELSYLRSLAVFVNESNTGDKSELASVPEDASIWHRVTSTRDNCLGQDCPFVRDCFVLKARRAAQEADVVVINHALYMSDLALREEGITDLLPATDLVVFDEAHQLPDIATRHLGVSISSYQLLDFARAVQVAGLAHARETYDWVHGARQLETAVRELHLQSSTAGNMPARRIILESMPEPELFEHALQCVSERLDALCQALTVVSARHPDLAACLASAESLGARLRQWQGIEASSQAPSTDESSDTSKEHAPSGDQLESAVRWIEHTDRQFRLHLAPLSVARQFAQSRAPGQAWVLTSATLSVHGDFGHFNRQLGLGDARSCFWESPYDYARQALLYVPDTLPPVQHPQFIPKFVAALLPLIEASEGGTLVLCTTLRAVKQVADELRAHFEAQGLGRPVLQQGEHPRGVLLSRFQAEARAVLVGSASFWEGIDLPGKALTLVAIDKLPFAPPDDPVLHARLERCRRRGGNPFMEYQIPQAAIALKQGAGRLIRSQTDQGVLMVADARLVDKPYGRLLWRGLPPFARTREGQRAAEFLQTAGPIPVD